MPQTLFTSPRLRGEVGERSEPGEGVQDYRESQAPSPRPSPRKRGRGSPLPISLSLQSKTMLLARFARLQRKDLQDFVLNGLPSCGL